MSSYSFETTRWGGRSRIDNIEQELSSLSGGAISSAVDVAISSDTAVTGTGDIIWSTGGTERGRIHNAGDLVFVGKAAYNGGGFTNSLDSTVWVAGSVRTNPTTASEGIYTQHRINGSSSAVVHDAVAAELRLAGVSGATFLNAFEASVVFTAGSNTVTDVRAITANITFTGSPTGTITSAHGIRVQNVGAGGPTITTAYGAYVEAQTRGTTNWSLYAPSGNSLVQALWCDNPTVSALRALHFSTNAVDRWQIRANGTAEGGANAGSDLEIVARDDSGANIGTVLTLTRSSRAVGLGSGPLGFFGTTPGTKPTITGAKGSNVALGSLLSALATLGLLTDSTTA